MDVDDVLQVELSVPRLNFLTFCENITDVVR